MNRDNFTFYRRCVFLFSKNQNKNNTFWLFCWSLPTTFFCSPFFLVRLTLSAGGRRRSALEAISKGRESSFGSYFVHRLCHYDGTCQNKRQKSNNLLKTEKKPFSDLGSLLIGNSQCGNLRIFLLMRFYVKSILVILKPQKTAILTI